MNIYARKNKSLSLCLMILAASALQGCSGVKDSMGLEKGAPDEFKVITRAPLEIPPNLTLPPPNIGAPRPQEKAPIVQAKEAVFGEDTKSTSDSILSSSEGALLQKAGAENADPEIRKIVDRETLELKDRNKPVAEKLLNISGHNNLPSATIVNAKEEKIRIDSNKQAGKDITDGITPTIED